MAERAWYAQRRMARSLAAALALVCLACSGMSSTGAGDGTSGSERPPTAPRAPRPIAPRAGASAREVSAPEASPRVIFEVPGIGEVTVRVEIARTPAQRARGLMFRRSVDADAGMLFVYPYPRPRSFWMRNTYVSLDMIFVGRDRRVVGVIERAEPRTDDLREIDSPSQYVVEVNAGFARAHGIFAGVPVRFEGVPDVLPGAPEVEDDPEDEDEMEAWVE